MLYQLFQGFLLGLAYVASIGLQNLNVINTGIQQKAIIAYQVATITIVFDILLALACFFGVGYLIDKFELIKRIILLCGSLVIIYIGFSLIAKDIKIENEEKLSNTLLKRILICFAVTWLNPQAIIDGSMLLGGYYASVPERLIIFFISGFCLASIIWFLMITTITVILRKNINKKILRIINIVCGVVLLLFGAKLFIHFIQIL